MLPPHLFGNRPTSASLALLLHLRGEMERIEAELLVQLSPTDLADHASIAIANVRQSGLDAVHKHYWGEATKVVRCLLRSKAGRAALASAGLAGDTPAQVLSCPSR